MAEKRTVLHVDLDAFYASVEQRDDPSLRGKPVIVAGPPPRGVVAAASYEARRFGVRSAIPTAQALQRCPHAVLVHPRMSHYADVSDGFFEILRTYSPLVEGLSLDEAFLDATGEERLFGDGAAIGRLIKERVRAELRIVASVGVAPSKFVAKIASDLGKPDGLLVVDPARVIEFLAPLPVGRLWGVGEVTEQSLRGMGIATVGDLARLGEDGLAPLLGRDRARHLARLAVGDDPRPVEPDRAAVSIGSEDTFERDFHDRDKLRAPILGQADHAAMRLRRLGRRARTITLKIKYADHTLVTRRTTLDHGTTDGHLVGETALELLSAVPDIERRGVRLTGVTLSGFDDGHEPAQLTLDLDGRAAAAPREAAVRGEKLGETLDAIAAKFGRAAVKRAIHLDDEAGAARPPALGPLGPKKPDR